MQTTCEKCDGTEIVMCFICFGDGNRRLTGDLFTDARPGTNCHTCEGGKVGCPICVLDRLPAFSETFKGRPGIESTKVVKNRGTFLVITSGSGLPEVLMKELTAAAQPYGVAIVSKVFFESHLRRHESAAR